MARNEAPSSPSASNTLRAASRISERFNSLAACCRTDFRLFAIGQITILDRVLNIVRILNTVRIGQREARNDGQDREERRGVDDRSRPAGRPKRDGPEKRGRFNLGVSGIRRREGRIGRRLLWSGWLVLCWLGSQICLVPERRIPARGARRSDGRVAAERWGGSARALGPFAPRARQAGDRRNRGPGGGRRHGARS